jgi:hypothetical protein
MSSMADTVTVDLEDLLAYAAYVLFAPDRSVSLYREAYVRTSSTPYNLDDLTDRSEMFGLFHDNNVSCIEFFKSICFYFACLLSTILHSLFRAAHLTNDAVQKKLESYHEFEDHCKLRMEELQVWVVSV